MSSLGNGDEQPNAQPWSPPDSDEEIADDTPRTLKRTKPSFGGKRPLVNWGYSPGYEQDQGPDLGDYFDQWDLSEKKQILICRGYASYLAAMQDAKKK